ncbi:prephenate dehydrogenase [Haloferula sp. A504]|uniref:prephenate dehydrogenase n=1 Tax=Haloferula sp. A504 TaxID=3373601 RepID=UPI0031C9DF16|nr:prephenate dehydrogenase/arogenate dehydrogenase family protein [Verrucomicrobiaceae bacterium E54]
MGFSKVAVLGGGLLGGSVALALRDRLDCVLWARRAETVGQARDAGVPRATTNLEEALDEAELVILAVPVGAMPGLLRQAIDAGIRPGAVISDVGSVKQRVHEQLGPIARGGNLAFIGGHPMAGSERKGFEAADADLFEGSVCLLTDDEGIGDPAAARLEAFWTSLGCRVTWMEASAHDQIVARISHLPHVMAAATARVAMKSPEDARFGGGGLRDTTRVAGGDPGMWAEILMENAPALLGPVREARDRLSEMLAMIEQSDHEALRQWLELACERHAEGKTRRENQGDD